jgi:hypothetical protein
VILDTGDGGDDDEHTPRQIEPEPETPETPPPLR